MVSGERVVQRCHSLEGVLLVWSRNNLSMFHPKKFEEVTIGNARRVDYYSDGKKLEHAMKLLIWVSWLLKT